MILGLSTSAFTLIHVALSLVGILAGCVALGGLIAFELYEGWTAIFLVTTAATSVTGFLFPVAGLDPARIVGILSLVALAIATFALYWRYLAGHWRWIFIVSAVLALYLNVFVGVVQAFQKIPFLHRLAPTQSEPPFLVVQIGVMAAFIVLGILAVWRFRPHFHL